jgi:hypothetical protein
MDDLELVERINALVEEEHRLRESHESGSGAITDDERVRLEALEVQLDQCWDLLRQRRARREFGEDPSGAAVRDPGTVEHYRQ